MCGRFTLTVSPDQLQEQFGLSQPPPAELAPRFNIAPSQAVAVVANQFTSGGLRLLLPPWLFAVGIVLSLVTGTLGGLYPAWRAARLVPMDAIRIGSH